MPTGWGDRGDVAGLLEAMYRMDVPEPEWLAGACTALEPLVPGAQAVVGVAYRVVPGQEGFRPICVAGSEQAARLVADTAHQADLEFVTQALATDRRVAVLSQLFGERLPGTPVAAVLGQLGASDALALQTVSTGSAHEGVYFGVASAEPIVVSAPASATWHRVAAHLAATVRLRRGGADAHPVEGVLTPDGRLEHAEGEGRGRAAREALSRAARAIDRVRTTSTRRDPAALLEAWRAIVERRWTLVDVVESDGRRYMLARVNPPAVVEHRALTARERQVAALLVQGVPQKAVAYELSMSPSTVAFHVKNIARKVGASTSTELVRLLAAGQAAPPRRPGER